MAEVKRCVVAGVGGEGVGGGRTVKDTLPSADRAGWQGDGGSIPANCDLPAAKYSGFFFKPLWDDNVYLQL